MFPFLLHNTSSRYTNGLDTLDLVVTSILKTVSHLYNKHLVKVKGKNPRVY